MEKISQHGKSTWPRLPHTGRPHARVYLTALNTDWRNRTREALRRDTQSRRQGITQGKLIDPSQKPDSSSRLKISP
ncbi:Inositol 2-dehydrogenase [Gossypium arboreum]|uniref:Inositol 2-dehydrogenase n=1 Tax=Gossypium arboreum TaxID=29729 RepID=A0A0B0NGC4_GOSAR|nr:Inositol 2-dehydrogenase [Gossypium arboreum]